MNQTEFLLWEQNSRDTIDFKKIYVDITEDLISGLLLSQIVYWYLPNKDGKTKLRVMIEGKQFLCKSRDDWWDECRISPKRFDRASKILVDKKLIEKRIKRFNGLATMHIRLDIDKLIELISKELKKQKESLELEGLDGITLSGNPEVTKGKKRNSPKGKTGIDQKVKPKSTKSKKQNSLKGKTEIPQRVNTLTESTTEDYQQKNNYIENDKENSKEKSDFSSLPLNDSNNENLKDTKNNAPILPVECKQYLDQFVVRRLETDRYFYNLNFDEGMNYNILMDSIIKTQSQDNVEVLGLDQYGYFTATIKNMLDQIQ